MAFSARLPGMTTQQETTPRRGRRPGPGSTRGAVLDAARARFARDGFTATTIRAVAADAAVDPSQVMQFYRSKEELFSAIMAVPETVLHRFDAAFADPGPGLGRRVVEAFFATWEGPPEESEPLIAALRGAVMNEQARARLVEFVQSRWTGSTDHGDEESSALRVGLALSTLMGVTLSRSVLGVPAMTSADRDTLVTHLTPAIDALLAPAQR